MTDCVSCKHYLKAVCDNPERVGIEHLFYCREQMFYLIQHLFLLEDGERTPSPRGTGYTDSPITGGNFKRNGNFVAAAELYAIISSRLDKCGEAGEVLVHEAKLISVVMDLSIENLSGLARKALSYISGAKERKQGFAEWKAMAKYREKGK